VPRVGDADFTTERLVARADDELANGLGNLVNRVVAMIHRYRGGLIPAPAPVPPGGEDLDAAIRLAGDRVGAALAGFDFRQATAAVWAIADEANRFINRVRPWELARADHAGRLDAVLYLLARACTAAGRELVPFLPDAAARVTAQCTPDGDGRLPDPSPVFRRLAAGARSLPAAAGFHVEDPQQEQDHQGADDRPDDADRVEAVNAQRTVLDQVLQEAPDEGADDAERAGAEASDGIPAWHEQPGDGAGDEADDQQHDDEYEHAGLASQLPDFM
jgi:hypothetical protein